MKNILGKFISLVVLVTLCSLALPGLVSLADSPMPLYALGLVPSPVGDYPRASLDASAGPLPERVDLSSGLPLVGFQGRQASCVAWAVAYYTRSYQEGVEQGRVPRQTDELFSPTFIYNQRTTTDCSQDKGMSMVSGLKIAVNQGLATLATTPYDPNDSCTQPSAAARAEAQRYRASSYLNLFAGAGNANLTLVKQRLAAGELVLLAIPIYSEFYRVSALHPIIDVPAPASTFYGGHAVAVVGYDEVAQTFKFVNSWGSGWAEHGFGYLTYGFVQSKAWEAWVLVDADTTPPDLAERAYELGGVQNDVVQEAVSNPTFAWQESRDPSAVYIIYWGPDANGTSETARTHEGTFTPQPLTQSATFYLRVRAQDAAGNATPWRTLFTFRYEQSPSQGDGMSLQPFSSNPGAADLNLEVRNRGQ